MIIDTLENLASYSALNKNINIILEFIEKNKLQDIPEGKIELSNDVFAIVSSYKTKHIDEGFIEYHKKYIDIHIVLNGSEKIGFVPFSLCKQKNFFEDQDYGELLGKPIFFSLKPGMFVLFFTLEGHMPQINEDINNYDVKKIVFKINKGIDK